jgi:hypothetical protein
MAGSKHKHKAIKINIHSEPPGKDKISFIFNDLFPTHLAFWNTPRFLKWVLGSTYIHQFYKIFFKNYQSCSVDVLFSDLYVY